MTDVRDIALLLSQQRTTKQDRDPIYRGEIVQMRNNAGADSIHVDNRPLYVWVRLWAGQGSVVPVYNERVAAVNELPVLVSRRPGSINELEIIGLDIEILQSQSDPNIGLATPLHSASHEWPDAGPGIDPLTVYPRSWSQLKVYPQNPLSTSVDVSPLRHQAASSIVIFNGGTVALAAAIGALAANQARLVLIYLDTSTNTLATANGAIGTIADGWTLAEPAIPASDAYLSAVVRIYFGQTTIDEFDIRDRRFFLNPVPGTISNVSWCNVWVVAACGGDFTTIAAAVADARVIDGDALFIMPDQYGGWTTAKSLSYIALTAHNPTITWGAAPSPVYINANVTFNDATPTLTQVSGIHFGADVTIDYDPQMYFLHCGFNGTVFDGVNSTVAPGWVMFESCWFNGATYSIDATNGSGWFLELKGCYLTKGIRNPNQGVQLWDHSQAGGGITASTRQSRDAVHIQRAAYGPEIRVVGNESSQYATVALAIAAVGVGEAILILTDSWVCNNQTLPAGTTLHAQTKDETEIYTTTAVNTIQLADNALLHDITVLNEFNTAADAACVLMAMTTATGEVQNLIVLSDNDTGLGAGIRVTATNSTAIVRQCHVRSTGAGGSSYALYADGAGTTTLVRGGYYNGTNGDIVVNNGTATIVLTGPILVNGTITVTAGSVVGYWYDVNGNYNTAPSGGDIRLQGVGRVDFDVDEDSSIRASADDVLAVEVAAADQVEFRDGEIRPFANNDIDLGTATRKYKDAWFDGTVYSDHIDMVTIGNRIDLDTDGDTSIRASADDVISLEVGGSDRGQIDDEGVKAPARITEGRYHDIQLTSATGTFHFRENAAGVPTGWNVVNAALTSNQTQRYSFWYLAGSPANPNMDYNASTTVDLEVDRPANAWTSWTWGPFFFRDGGFGADVDYYIGICGTTAAAIDPVKYVRVHLQWNFAGSIWRIQGESDANDGGGQTASGWTTLTAGPLVQPLFFRFVIRNNAGVKTCRSYWAHGYFPESHTTFQSVAENTVWGNIYWRINRTRGVGVEDYVLTGACDYLEGIP